MKTSLLLGFTGLLTSLGFIFPLFGDGEGNYSSVWAHLFPATLENKEQRARLSPIFREFYAAAEEKRLKKATKLWQKFQANHGSLDGEFEDAVQEKLATWGAKELERCRQLAAENETAVGKIEAALKKLAEEAAGAPPFPDKATD